MSVEAPILSDAERERKIEAALRRMVNAVRDDDRRKFQAEMVELIRGRSAEQIVSMERARGLRR